MKTLEVGEKKKRVKALLVGDVLWLHVDGQTWAIEPQAKSTTRKGAQNTNKGGDIYSPMPGKILKVQVRTGDKVREKQVLVVMEAMKMEYSLTAAKDGIVKEVSCKENQQVELNQLLVRVE